MREMRSPLTLLSLVNIACGPTNPKECQKGRLRSVTALDNHKEDSRSGLRGACLEALVVLLEAHPVEDILEEGDADGIGVVCEECVEHLPHHSGAKSGTAYKAYEEDDDERIRPWRGSGRVT